MQSKCHTKCIGMQIQSPRNTRRSASHQVFRRNLPPVTSVFLARCGTHLPALEQPASPPDTFQNPSAIACALWQRFPSCRSTTFPAVPTCWVRTETPDLRGEPSDSPCCRAGFHSPSPHAEASCRSSMQKVRISVPLDTPCVSWPFLPNASCTLVPDSIVCRTHQSRKLWSRIVCAWRSTLLEPAL